MSGFSKWLSLTLFTVSVYGQVPATNDTSDGHGNTGMGTSALGGPTPPNLTGYNNTAAGRRALQSTTSGIQNTGAGEESLFSNTTGYSNTATGYYSLYKNTTGYQNTAAGVNAMAANTTGANNTAVGDNALEANTTSHDNTGLGQAALYSNTTGYQNTAVGSGALRANTTGLNNTATGYWALYANTTGQGNTAYGYWALYANTTGLYNTASGRSALQSNTIGGNNSASGQDALFSNTTGNSNTAYGRSALQSNTTGSDNIAIGYNSGFNLTDGSGNIDIGNPGEEKDGTGTDTGVIRIGTQSPIAKQTSTFIAGIYDNTSVAGLPVVIDSNGQLGTMSSSERFKTDIAPIVANAARIQKLRPVTFHYKADPNGALRYGLIAEEVANVYPELAVRGRNGRIDGIRYDELAPILVSEVQRQQRTIAAQAREILELRQQQKQFATRAELKGFEQQLKASLAALRSKDRLVAQR